MTKYKSVTAFAPATVANVGCGFDIMGFAVEGIGDKVTVSVNAEGDNSSIELKGEYGHLIPSERHRNTAGVAVDAFLKAIGGSELGLKISLEKNLPLGSGMGSSAASAAAAVYALNQLLGSPLSTPYLIPFAMEGERIACGTAHADNVAPSLLGGFVLIRSYEPLDIIPVNCPDDLFVALVHPHMQLNTADSRKVLDKDISVEKAVIHSANTAGFMVALLNSDYELLKRSMSDGIAEPKRKHLIPGFEAIKNAAISAGAIGCGISGSGPSVFSICRGEKSLLKITEVMKKGFLNAGLESEAFSSGLNAPGAFVTEIIESD